MSIRSTRRTGSES